MHSSQTIRKCRRGVVPELTRYNDASACSCKECHASSESKTHRWNFSACALLLIQSMGNSKNDTLLLRKADRIRKKKVEDSLRDDMEKVVHTVDRRNIIEDSVMTHLHSRQKRSWIDSK